MIPTDTEHLNRVIYRKARSEDWEAIAELHTKSWQENYRGDFSHHYLDHEAAGDRRAVWEKRFEESPDNQYVIVAERSSKICGFACTYGGHDKEYGSLLDNLHISTTMRSKGIGATLLIRSTEWAFDQYPECEFYLWVLLNNIRGIKFYQRLGAKTGEPTFTETPSGGKATALRCWWSDMSAVARS